MSYSIRMLNRRQAITGLGAVAANLAGVSCLLPAATSDQGSARLAARPRSPGTVGTQGRSTFSTDRSSAVLYVPPGVERTAPAPLLVFLHGANRTVDFFVDKHREAADRHGVVVLAPYATQGTWDAIRGRFGPDVTTIDEALRWTFDRWTIGPSKIVLSGFSDGGTYALAVGRANGGLFGRVVAYSPGFLIPIETVGKPPVLISHGTQDTILPIDATSRRIVPALRDAGYSVDYREFDGPHTVPQDIMGEVVQALANG